jgi:6-phosphogluconolactonase
MKILKDNWVVFKDADLLTKALFQEILHLAEKSIETNSSFSIVLTGGQSILNLYKMLSESSSDWNKWHIYIGDERCLPINHKDRNDRMINETWLDNIPIPKENIHFIKAELGLLEARVQYENTLKKIDKFDVVLLSMGEDGHIASLFPGHAYSKDLSVIIEKDSPKPPKERISMSYQQLSKAHYVFKLIIGESKQKAVTLLKQNANLPITRVNGDCEKIYLCKNAIL